MEVDENDAKIRVKTENLRKRSKNPSAQLDRIAADRVDRHESRALGLDRREHARWASQAARNAPRRPRRFFSPNFVLDAYNHPQTS